jgi:hypothetical protein
MQNNDPSYEIMLMEFPPLPEHKGSLTIKHNPHKDVDIKLEPYLMDLPIRPVFDSGEDLQACIETDEIWIIQWYPDRLASTVEEVVQGTKPVSFHWVGASTLEKALSLALNWEKVTKRPPPPKEEHE